jgi:PAS domain S-box-containing protein
MREAELDLIDVLEYAPVGTVIIDNQDQHVLFWNTSLLAILGGLQGESFAAAAKRAFFYHQSDFLLARAHLTATGALLNYETRIWREDGEEAWASISMRPIHFEHRAATLIWYFDITEAKRREHQLESSQDALLQVLDAAPAGTALTDGPERISYWNSALLKIVPANEEDPSVAVRSVVALAREEIAAHGQGCIFRMPTSDDTERFVSAWKSKVEFEGARCDLLWLHDVTEPRRAEHTARAATAAKSAFLATMSHEIRTPMNGVLTIAELLADTPLREDQAQMIGIIQQSADGLLRVINDILDFSKLEASQLQIETVPFALDEVLDSLGSLMMPQAVEKGIELHIRHRGIGSAARIGDPLRLRQVLLNLVGNAIKFTDSGSVTLDVAADGPTVCCRVIDTGIGIAPDQIPRLLKPYQQAEAITARRYGGSGLGLSICSALLALMGGSMHVESTPGVGSCFSITMDLPQDETQTVNLSSDLTIFKPHALRKLDRAAAEAHTAVILCAEDNVINRDVLGRVLDRLGLIYDMAEDGIQAMEMLDRKRHGLVLTDGHMPNMNGWDLTRTIRRMEAEAGLPRLPVMMLTADAMAMLDKQTSECGVDGCLMKPLRLNQLEAAVLQSVPILRTGHETRTATPSRVAPAGTPFALDGLIELVGDSPDDLRDFLHDFEVNARALQDEIGAALADDDHARLTAAAHSLKGAARYAGARAIAEPAAALEAGAKAAMKAGQLNDLVVALAQAIATLPGDIAVSLAGLREPANRAQQPRPGGLTAT